MRIFRKCSEFPVGGEPAVGEHLPTNQPQSPEEEGAGHSSFTEAESERGQRGLRETSGQAVKTGGHGELLVPGESARDSPTASVAGRATAHGDE